jgi:hypothetical protein
LELERTAITGLVLLLLVLWLGFAVHRSPRFPGSLWGGVFAVSAALMMTLFPLAYAAVKRVPALKKAATRRVTMRALLTWHVWTGAVGSILAILHTGHRFESNLGIALTAMMLLSLLSGYVARYFLGYVSMELREKQDLLNRLATHYNLTAGEASRRPDFEAAVAAPRGIFSRVVGGIPAPADVTAEGAATLPHRAVRLAESIADLEYAIKTHELFKRRSAYWLKIHVAASCAFYLLLVLHVWAAIYFGLRWFD